MQAPLCYASLQSRNHQVQKVFMCFEHFFNQHFKGGICRLIHIALLLHLLHLKRISLISGDLRSIFFSPISSNLSITLLAPDSSEIKYVDYCLPRQVRHARRKLLLFAPHPSALCESTSPTNAR